MEKVEQTGSFTIACRYVPYDQWFVTHAHPGWKVKRLKESIIAKALNLPFDRRLLEVDIPVIRPPSPITFAPDETERPISPIKFARRPVALKKSRATISLDSSTDREVVADKDEVSGGEGGVPVEQEDARTSEGSETLIAEDEDDDRMDAISFDSGDGYEEDDESDDGLHPLARTRTPTGGRVYVPPIEIPGPPGGSLSALSPSQPSGLTSIHIRPRHGAPISVPGGLVQSQQAARDKEQIYTAAFTFVRYSTGQVLEDDFNVGWYNLLPNELLEVHSSSPPLSFLVSAFLSDILTKGGSHSIQGLVAALANGYSAGSGAADATALSLSKVGFSMSPSLASSAGGALGSAPTHGHSSSVISSFMNGEVPGVSYQSYNSSSSSNAKKLTVSLPLSSPPILTSLPRQDTQAYIQPYWEGWVRVLRVVYRPELDAMAQYSLGGFHGSGGGNPAAFMALGGHQFEGMGGMGTNLGLWAKDPGLYVTGADLSRQHDYGEGGTTSKRKTKMEWRDRWVVIRDGMVFLCKDREVCFVHVA
ncbi:hypothetical protein CPB83DRAFT_59904 [Crepidotus variabilis]|uniref:Uncharacterized protein n=1 Tax=Crepidotus variabilis TaxID=179855 RepID=A0A9P6E6A2_9AGAR|nr:hypothetical protein CPB83DRAFT_59904 [Crepidotus variabilis]